MYTLEKLVELGFKAVKDENTGLTDFVNEVTSNVHLVISPAFDEFFIWIIDEDAEDEDMEGTKIIIDTSDVEQAISFCQIIVGVDNGF